MLMRSIFLGSIAALMLAGGASAVEPVTAATSCAIVAAAADDPDRALGLFAYERDRLKVLDAEGPPPSVLAPLDEGGRGRMLDLIGAMCREHPKLLLGEAITEVFLGYRDIQDRIRNMNQHARPRH